MNLGSLSILAILASISGFDNAQAAAANLRVEGDTAAYSFSESDSEKLYSFLSAGAQQDPGSFQVEEVAQGPAAATILCGKKHVKKFGQRDFDEYQYVCKSPEGKVFGDRAKSLFEAQRPIKEITTVHGKNIGCTQFKDPRNSALSYACGIAISSDGTTESDAPWISF